MGSLMRPRTRSAPTTLPFLVEPDGLLESLPGLLRAVREALNLTEIGEALRAQLEDVGCGRDRYRLTAEALGLVELAAS